MKWFTINISNSSLLLTYSFHYLMKNLFSVPISNPYQIVLHSFIAKFNASMKIPLTKYSLRFLTRFWSGSRLWKNCPLILFHAKQRIFSELCSSNFFMFEFNVFSDKIPGTKYLNLSNGPQLTSWTVKFYIPTHFNLVWWKLYFFFKILAKLCFFNKIPDRKHWHLSNDLKLTW